MYIFSLIVTRCEFFYSISSALLFQVYDPPVPEFAVSSVKVSGKLPLPKVSGPSIIIVVDGDVGITADREDSSRTLKKGSVVFLPVDGEVILEPVSHGQSCHLFQAYCSL